LSSVTYLKLIISVFVQLLWERRHLAKPSASSVEPQPPGRKPTI